MNAQDFERESARRLAQYHAASPETRVAMDNSAKAMFSLLTGQAWTAPTSAWCGLWNAMTEFVREKANERNA